MRTNSLTVRPILPVAVAFSVKLAVLAAVLLPTVLMGQGVTTRWGGGGLLSCDGRWRHG